MRKSNPHNSSFFFESLYKIAPYNEWLQLATTPRESQILKRTFHFTPQGWLDWVDIKVNNSIKRGIVIHNQLYYRLSILRSGIILLQETKYICDAIENALKQIIITHINSYELTYAEITESDKGLKTILKKYEKTNGVIELPFYMVTPNFINTLIFSKLTEIISQKWTCFSKERNIPGFGNYFRSNNKCRDLEVFKIDMKIIRNSRNAIAHSNKLFSKGELEKLFKISAKWLSPLDIDLSQKILSYRRQRPMFLQDLNIL